MLNIIRIDEVEKFTKIQHILSELSKKKKNHLQGVSQRHTSVFLVLARSRNSL